MTHIIGLIHLRDNDTLVSLLSDHEMVGIVCYGKDVGWFFSYPLVGISSDVLFIVDRKDFVRIDSNQDGSSVGLRGKKNK